MITAAEAIRPRLLYEGVADAIRDSIFEHRLPPGTAIDELALSRHYGVSRTPVREAIKVLVRDGLLNMRTFSGCSVNAPQRDDLRQALEVISLLDGFVLRRLAASPKARIVSLIDAWQNNARQPEAWRKAVWSSFCEQARAALDSPVFLAAGRGLGQQIRLAVGPVFDRIDGELSPENRLALAAALLAGDLPEIDRQARLHHDFFQAAVLGAICCEAGDVPAHSQETQK